MSGAGIAGWAGVVGRNAPAVEAVKYHHPESVVFGVIASIEPVNAGAGVAVNGNQRLRLDVGWGNHKARNRAQIDLGMGTSFNIAAEFIDITLVNEGDLTLNGQPTESRASVMVFLGAVAGYLRPQRSIRLFPQIGAQNLVRVPSFARDLIISRRPMTEPFSWQELEENSDNQIVHHSTLGVGEDMTTPFPLGQDTRWINIVPANTNSIAGVVLNFGLAL